MSVHYDEELLTVYALDPASVPNRVELEQHLAGCPECRLRLELVLEIENALGAAETWQVVVDVLTNGNQRTRFRETFRRERREDEDAERLLSKAVRNPLEFAFLNLARERLQTAGCVRRLSRASHQFCESNPLHARNLADAAILIASNLREEVYGESVVYMLRASAYCERANALRYLGEFDEAHASLDRADEALTRTVAPPVERARIDYIRATLLWKQRDFVEALRLVRLAGRTFGEYGEESRKVDAKIIEADILFDQGDAASALAILGPIYEAANASTAPLLAARLSNIIGNCHLELHQLTLANQFFRTSLQRFEQLGLTTEVVRAHWNLARLAFVSGDTADAIGQLRVVRRQFESLEMLYEAALVILDLMDALLELRDTREIVDLAATVADHVYGSGAIGAALTAAAFVRREAALGHLRRTDIRYVRTYLAELEQNPALTFTPPAPEIQI